MHTDCIMWGTEGNGLGKQAARGSCTGSWVWHRAHPDVYRTIKQSCILPSKPVPCHHAGYLYTVGSRSPECVRGSGRAVVGTPRSHTAPGHYGRCTACRSRCSMSPLPRNTLLRVRGKWRECWSLASAPQSHLRNDTEPKHEKLFTGSFCNRWGNGWCLL